MSYRLRVATACVRAPCAILLIALVASATNAAILSAKRGFADTGANYGNLQATGAGWYYTWGTGVGNPGNFDARHYPMFWNAPSQSTINNVRSRNPEWVLGFNEPERSDQANMSVSQAIASWTTISNSFAGTATKLASPAVSDTSTGQAWLSSFMQQAAANSLRVDAVAFHWYGVSNPNNPAGAASSFLSRVDSYHNTYNKPVFITEFAIHDWGGVYTDAEIIEANRQFINIVIPALESRSYVVGYAWYHWFSDARLYEGNPPRPTPMAYNYVGAVGPGQIENISGQNLGEHVAYLTGGELTMTGATPGTIKYINALAGASSISGGMNWELTGSNWVRIQPGATLRKVGANQITFSGGTITNNGLLEVAQGTLLVGSSVSGTGSVRIKGGTLTLMGLGSLGSGPLVDVRPGGTLDVTSLSRGANIASGQVLNIEPGGQVIGNVNALLGATFSGGGTITGNMTSQTGSLLRVGQDAAGVPSRILIDNFESYALGDVRATASPPWTAHQDTSLADIENFNGNKVLTYGWTGGFRGLSRSLPEPAVIANDQTATFFFRINSKTGSPDHSFGLADRATTGTVDFNDFEAQLRMKPGATGGTFALDARNGGAFSATLANGLALNTWYNVWMVVNQPADTYDLYMNTGANAATAANKLNAAPLAFRNGTTSDLNTILALAGTAPIDNGVRIDDLVFMNGFDLTNPIAGFDPGLVWNAETLSVAGNYLLASGAVLDIDLGGSAAGQYDVLSIGGTATLDGSLRINLAGGFTPSPGDTFHIVNASTLSGTPSLTGDASGFSLLTIPEGLALFFGDLPPGDYDRNGVVDAEDYSVWRASFGGSGDLRADGNGDGIVDAADYIIWRKHATNSSQSLGASQLGVAATSGSRFTSNSSVPEPNATLLLAVGLASRTWRVRRAFRRRSCGQRGA